MKIALAMIILAITCVIGIGLLLTGEHPAIIAAMIVCAITLCIFEITEQGF